MSVEAERGYLIIAQNNSHTDYIRCARVLSRSIKAVEPDARVCLLTDQTITDPAFDFVRTFPFGDQSQTAEWKLHNDWQCFYASPFRETIKLEADMLLPVSIEHWFDICCHRELVVTISARNYLNERSLVRTYRKIFDENDLPDVYNAITYWRRSREAKEFFDTVRKIFENWNHVMGLLKYAKDQPLNTDLAYAIAMKTLGPDRYVLPGDVPGIIHMKSAINGTLDEDWTRELVWETTNQSLRINTVQSLWPVHYHIKEFAGKINDTH
jgi:hypothetical protein